VGFCKILFVGKPGNACYTPTQVALRCKKVPQAAKTGFTRQGGDPGPEYFFFSGQPPVVFGCRITVQGEGPTVTKSSLQESQVVLSCTHHQAQHPAVPNKPPQGGKKEKEMGITKWIDSTLDLQAEGEVSFESDLTQEEAVSVINQLAGEAVVSEGFDLTPRHEGGVVIPLRSGAWVEIWVEDERTHLNIGWF